MFVRKMLQFSILTRKVREDNQPPNVAVFREPTDSEIEVRETNKVIVIDADFQIVMKNTPDFRFEILSLPEIVKHYKAYHKHYFADD